MTSNSSLTVLPSPAACSACARALSSAVLANHSPGVSPGAGTMALSRMSIRAPTFSQTWGAVKPARDWATSTGSGVRPAALITAAAYSGRPASSSAAGSGTASA